MIRSTHYNSFLMRLRVSTSLYSPGELGLRTRILFISQPSRRRLAFRELKRCYFRSSAVPYTKTQYLAGQSKTMFSYNAAGLEIGQYFLLFPYQSHNNLNTSSSLTGPPLAKLSALSLLIKWWAWKVRKVPVPGTPGPRCGERR